MIVYPNVINKRAYTINTATTYPRSQESPRILSSGGCSSTVVLRLNAICLVTTPSVLVRCTPGALARAIAEGLCTSCVGALWSRPAIGLTFVIYYYKVRLGEGFIALAYAICNKDKGNVTVWIFVCFGREKGMDILCVFKVIK